MEKKRIFLLLPSSFSHSPHQKCGGKKAYNISACCSGENSESPACEACKYRNSQKSQKYVNQNSHGSPSSSQNPYCGKDSHGLQGKGNRCRNGNPGADSNPYFRKYSHIPNHKFCCVLVLLLSYCIPILSCRFLISTCFVPYTLYHIAG